MIYDFAERLCMDVPNGSTGHWGIPDAGGHQSFPCPRSQPDPRPHAFSATTVNTAQLGSVAGPAFVLRGRDPATPSVVEVEWTGLDLDQGDLIRGTLACPSSAPNCTSSLSVRFFDAATCFTPIGTDELINYSATGTVRDFEVVVDSTVAGAGSVCVVMVGAFTNSTGDRELALLNPRIVRP